MPAGAPSSAPAAPAAAACWLAPPNAHWMIAWRDGGSWRPGQRMLRHKGAMCVFRPGKGGGGALVTWDRSQCRRNRCVDGASLTVMLLQCETSAGVGQHIRVTQKLETAA